MELTELYEIEEKKRQALLDRDFSQYHKLGQEIYKKTLGTSLHYNKTADASLDVTKTWISRRLIKDVSKTAASGPRHRVDLQGLERQCREFVEGLLAVDLSGVKVVRIKDSYEVAEGLSLPCAKNRHLVVLPPEDDEDILRDVIVHEFGHAAEFVLRRKDDKREQIGSYRFLAETIAHFCQFSFLIQHGTTAERLNVLGSVTRDYLLLKAVLATRALNPQREKFDVHQVLGRPELSDFLSVYGQEQIKNILLSFQGAEVSVLHGVYAEARMGAVLAIRLLGDVQSVRKLCTVKSDIPIRQILINMGLDAAELLSFSDADSWLRRFVHG